MKRNDQSGAQKRQAKRRKIVEAAKSSQRLSSRLTRPETFKADEQDVSIPETESIPNLLMLTVSTIVPMKKIPMPLKIDQMQARMTTFPPLL